MKNESASFESRESPMLNLEAWLETWLADGGNLSQLVEDFDAGLLTDLDLDELVSVVDGYEEHLSEEEAVLLSDLSDFLDTTNDSSEDTWLDSALKQRLDHLESPDWNSFEEMKRACGPSDEFVIELENLPPDVWGRFNEETRVFLRQKIQNIVFLDFTNDLEKEHSLTPKTRGLSLGEGMVAINSQGGAFEDPNEFISTLLHEATHESEGKHDHSLPEEIRAYEGQLYYLNEVGDIPSDITDAVKNCISRGEFIQTHLVEKFPGLNHLHPGSVIYAHELIEHDVDLQELKEYLDTLDLEEGNEFQREFEVAIDAAQVFLKVLDGYSDELSQFNVLEYSMFPSLIELDHFTEGEFYLNLAEQFAALIHHRFPERNYEVASSKYETIYDDHTYLSIRSAYIFNSDIERSVFMESLAQVNSVQDLIALPDDHPVVRTMRGLASFSQPGEQSYYFDDLIHLSQYVTVYRAFNEYSVESLTELVLLLDDTYLESKSPVDLETTILYKRALDLLVESFIEQVQLLDDANLESESQDDSETTILYKRTLDILYDRYENLNRSIAMDPDYQPIYDSLAAQPKTYKPTKVPAFISGAFEELKSQAR